MEEQTNEVDIRPHSPPSEDSIGPAGRAPPGRQPSLPVAGDVKHYTNLHHAATEGEWKTAERIIHENPNALTAIISLNGMTALHVAARHGRSEFVENMVERLSARELTKPDKIGRTALHYIATTGTVRAAQKMVEKNPYLPQKMDEQGYTPICGAVLIGLPQTRKEMVKYLADVTTDEFPSCAFTGEHSARLILGIVAFGYYEIALDLITKYPNLAFALDENGDTILHVIAKDPSAFQSGPRLSFWNSLLHPRSIETKRQEKREQGALKLLVKSVLDAVLDLGDEENKIYVDSFIATMHLAAKNGVLELIKQILERFPDSMWLSQNDRLLLHVAIEHRRDKVFTFLIKRTGDLRFAFSNVVVKESGDNILHLAAKLAPISQLQSVAGTALQMQRELQWFKEVEKLVHVTKRWATNNEGKTPQQLFTEKHKELHKDAVEWMKDTSTSSMVVATLIATIVFTAMITVPGGLRSDNGTPFFLRKIPFVVFTISNGLSVFSSMTSLLVFLSILTSRYAEDDFLRSLPIKLVAGLSFLLIAVVTMTIAFAAALHIAVHSKFRLSYIVSVFLGCVPVILFLWLHLPLYVQVVKSTCGPGIFEQNDPKHWWSLPRIMQKEEQNLLLTKEEQTNEGRHFLSDIYC